MSLLEDKFAYCLWQKKEKKKRKKEKKKLKSIEYVRINHIFQFKNSIIISNECNEASTIRSEK